MNRKELVKNVVDTLKENNIRKPIKVPKQTFHISDDEGNVRNFTIKNTEKDMSYTTKDVSDIIDACIHVIEESIKNGDPVSIHGFGSLGLKYRKPRRTKCVGTDIDIEIEGHYVPKFSFGNDLRLCAKMYELSLNDRLKEPEPRYDDYSDFEEGAD